MLMSVRKTNILLFLIFLLSCSVIYGKSFSIENATIKYVINSDGRVHVVENIKYVLSCDYDRFHELYRELPKELPFDNASGYCIGDNCTFRYDPPEYSLSGNPIYCCTRGFRRYFKRYLQKRAITCKSPVM